MAGRGAYQKKAQNILNVRARHEFLLAGIRAPASVDKTARTALIGQRAFAALDLPRLKITPIALNTIKSLSDQIFTQPDEAGRTGFNYLNALRIRLNEVMAGVASTRTKIAKAERVENRVEQLQARLTAAELQGIKRQRAYLSLYTALNGLIKDKNLPMEAQHRLYRLLENHHAAFAELFEPNVPDPQVTQVLNKVSKSK
jgi:hypothetical protein